MSTNYRFLTLGLTGLSFCSTDFSRSFEKIMMSFALLQDSVLTACTAFLLQRQEALPVSAFVSAWFSNKDFVGIGSIRPFPGLIKRFSPIKSSLPASSSTKDLHGIWSVSGEIGLLFAASDARERILNMQHQLCGQVLCNCNFYHGVQHEGHSGLLRKDPEVYLLRNSLDGIRLLLDRTALVDVLTHYI